MPPKMFISLPKPKTTKANMTQPKKTILSEEVRAAIRRRFSLKLNSPYPLTHSAMVRFLDKNYPDSDAPSPNYFYTIVRDIRTVKDNAQDYKFGKKTLANGMSREDYEKLSAKVKAQGEKDARTCKATIARPPKSWTKEEAGPEPSDAKKKVLWRLETLLESRGRVWKVCGCVKRALFNGYLKLDGADPLNQVICEGQCESCGEKLVATLRGFIYQKNNGGAYYEDATGPIRCKCGTGHFVTELCEGNAHLESGKFHNHCIKCPDFGELFKINKFINVKQYCNFVKAACTFSGTI